jgi:hypothetical protein
VFLTRRARVCLGMTRLVLLVLLNELGIRPCVPQEEKGQARTKKTSSIGKVRQAHEVD